MGGKAGGRFVLAKFHGTPYPRRRPGRGVEGVQVVLLGAHHIERAAVGSQAARACFGHPKGRGSAYLRRCPGRGVKGVQSVVVVAHHVEGTVVGSQAGRDSFGHPKLGGAPHPPGRNPPVRVQGIECVGYIIYDICGARVGRNSGNREIGSTSSGNWPDGRRSSRGKVHGIELVVPITHHVDRLAEDGDAGGGVLACPELPLGRDGALFRVAPGRVYPMDTVRYRPDHVELVFGLHEPPWGRFVGPELRRFTDPGGRAGLGIHGIEGVGVIVGQVERRHVGRRDRGRTGSPGRRRGRGPHGLPVQGRGADVVGRIGREAEEGRREGRGVGLDGLAHLGRSL